MNYQRIYSPNDIRSFTTAAPFRLGKNLWSLRKGLSAENAVFSLDITPQISTSNNHGTKPTSFDVVYSVSGANLTSAPTDSLSVNSFANAANPTVTALTLTGGPYPTAVNSTGQVYVLRRTISGADYINTGVSAMNLELTFPCDANTILDILAVNINFTWQN